MYLDIIFKINLLLLLILTLIVSSCSESKLDYPDQIEEIKVSIHSNQIYLYELGAISTEGGYSISRKGSHSNICEIKVSTENKLVFEYQPSADFMGVDHVELRNCMSSGGQNCTKVILLQFEFTVTL